MANDEYVLGHADAELERLMSQGEYFGQLTEHVLELAGLAPGMAVLDVGCGAGDVSLLAARMVGPSGRVIGVDRSPDALALARRRATALGYAHVTFQAGDIAELALEIKVDAVIGRLVLMYFPDPARVLRHLATLVAPGGLVAFHEIHIVEHTSAPPCALWETSIKRLHDTFSRLGANPSMGLALAPTFRAAGLPRPQQILGARVESGAGGNSFAQLVGITRTLLPMMEKTGVATAAEVGIDDLADRLRAEVTANDATVISPSFIGAWARV